MLPPSPWIVASCALLGLLLAVFYFRDSERSTGEPRRLLGFALAGAVFVTLVVGGRIALRLPGVPYNVRELAGSYPTLSSIALSLALMACGGLPMAFALLWLQRPQFFARHFGWLVAGVATAVFVAAWLVVPIESIDDIVGTPVLKINDTLERWLRFVALFGGLLSAWTVGARVALRDFCVRPLVLGTVVTTAAMLISYVVVVPLAATDNIYELLRGSGGMGAAFGIAGYLVLLSTVFATLAWSVVMARGRFAVVVPVLLLILSVPDRVAALCVREQSTTGQVWPRVLGPPVPPEPRSRALSRRPGVVPALCHRAGRPHARDGRWRGRRAGSLAQKTGRESRRGPDVVPAHGPRRGSRVAAPSRRRVAYNPPSAPTVQSTASVESATFDGMKTSPASIPNARDAA